MAELNSATPSSSAGGGSNATVTAPSSAHRTDGQLNGSSQLVGPPEIESTISYLSNHKNVRGVMILNRDGVLIRSSGSIFQGSDGSIILRRYSNQVLKILDSVSDSVSGMELDDQLKLLRVRTRQHEIIITPGAKFILVVVQNPNK
ncbi:hypothetical protein BY996DRAFT_6901570 [Phakopsora pachyrhizi]|uniref:Expressed protein n=1 Tax=Phakopsora pachyrhizi TaxID=170000 RepID=A0AAV0BGU1_PHAPC|nr:hypothetical protein BY996DRAFT_6901570 [Phakopsora pachyrhizi]CAH7685463.1 expressed protein [Phakopsora pachyrhizi]